MGVRCIRRCVGGNQESDHTQPPHGASLSPKPSRQTGETQVYPPLCGEKLGFLSFPTPPRGVPIPQTAGGTGVFLPLCGPTIAGEILLSSHPNHPASGMCAHWFGL